MQTRTAITTAALALLTACGGGGGGSTSGFPTAIEVTPKPVQTEQPPNKAAPCSVALWGDSIAGLISTKLGRGLDVHNHWVAGTTSGVMLPVFLQDPLADRFVVIEFGFNDANAKQPIEASLRSMLDRVKSLGRTPVLTGTSMATSAEFDWINSTNRTIASLAQEYGAVYANWPGVQWAPYELMSDGQHPGAVYQQRLADALTAAIVAKAPECGVSS